MNNRQQGFTLIELVAVIVILGALAVVALPRFINLQDEAQEAGLQGVVGAASSAHAINLAGALASDQNYQQMTNCNNTTTVMQNATLDGYTFSGGAMSGPTGTPNTNCSVIQDDTGNSESFTGYYVSG